MIRRKSSHRITCLPTPIMNIPQKCIVFWVMRTITSGKYHEAMGAFEKYLANNKEEAPRRDALYMLGLSYYHSGVYTKAANTLGEVATGNDALSQNAYLHMGLSYLQMGDKNKARMAFEQASRL